MLTKERPPQLKIFEIGEWFYHGYRALQVEKRTRKEDEVFVWSGGKKYALSECETNYTEEDVMSAIELCNLAETDIEIATIKNLLKTVCTPKMKQEVWRRLPPFCRNKLKTA